MELVLIRCGAADVADKVLPALRYEFGGRDEEADAKKGGT
jgi:hypothetical protein